MITKSIQMALRHKWLVVTGFIGVCLAGAISLANMPIDAFPDISPNLVQVFAELEGMAPEEVEQFVTRPVEVAMRGIPGVRKIRSISSLGLSTVNIYFEDDVDIYLARQLVSERIKEAQEGIPGGVNMPHGIEMGAVASGMGHILAYYLEAEKTGLTEQRTLQDWVIKRDLQTVPGVAKIISQGGYERQYQIRVSPDLLLEYGLTIDDIVSAIRENNLNLGAGIIEKGSEELVVRTIGMIETVADIENTVVCARDGSPIYIKNVATVEFGEAFRRGVGILNGGKEIVTGSVYKLHGANSFEVIDRLKKRIDEINSTLPGGVRMEIFYDQSALVSNSINTVRNSLALGLVLVCLVSFLFLGDFRNALIVLCSLPFSTLFAFILMKQAAIPGDLISFGGIAIALGMIVDATIIIVEKIYSTFGDTAKGSPIESSILAAAGEVGRPIFFAIVIIITVFLPIFTLGEVEGKMFRPLAFAVSTTMVGSLIYALVIAPVFYQMLHGKRHGVKKGREVPAALIDRYRSILLYSLERRKLVVTVISVLVAAGIIVFSLLGREFVPTLQEGSVQVLAYMNPNISLEEIEAATGEISRDIMSFPEVRNVIADIGYGEVGPHMHHTNYACMTVTLRPKNKWKTSRNQEELVERIDQRLSGYPGVSFSFSQPIKHEVDGLVGGSGSTVVAKLFGHDMSLLREKAAEIVSALGDVEGVADMRIEQVDGQTQLQIEMDRARIARHGLSSLDVQLAVQRALAGEEAGKVFEGEKIFAITVRYEEDYRGDIGDIEELLLRTPAGYNVPLKELARIEAVTGLRQISREDTRRYISIQCNVRGRDAGSFVRDAQKAVDAGVSIPAGYMLAWGGQFELQQAANRRLGLIIPLTLLLVLMMLYGLFNSFSDVLLIMLNIPLALVGGVFALLLFRENVSIPSSIGFIALFGIALTDGLVLVSRFDHLRKKGMELREAVITGCMSKLRPVLMTTITTALGLMPLVIASGTGSEIQRPLAVVVIGGLVSSTILTLIVLPTLYEWVTRRRGAGAKDRRNNRSGMAG
ncbi:MAG: efflux RND transporter permease subunit [Candidatus Krumholzibacteriota bacterium]|nr:efflux RND transporter permease subunit [Candidatus Krumholzibacteriota bacterium]